MAVLKLLIPLLTAALASALAAMALRPFARRAGIVSVANGDRAGSGGIPVIGGLGVLIGTAAGLLGMVVHGGGTVWGGSPQASLPLGLLPLGLLLLCYAALGHLDDRFDLSARLRFVSESLLAVALAGWWLLGSSLVSGPISSLALDSAAGPALGSGLGAAVGLPVAGAAALGLPPAWAAPLGLTFTWAVAAFLVVAGANAFNMCDNSDGLAAGVGTIALLGVFCLRTLAGGPDGVAWVSLAAAGALIGFLYWNRPPARIYLGDAGTLPMGALVAWGLITLPGVARIEVLLALPLTAGYLLFDPLLAVQGRLARRRAPWRGGVDHPAHDLRPVLGGWPTAWAVILAVQIFSVATAVALALRLLSPAWVFLGLAPWLVLAAAVVAGRRLRAER